MERESKYLQTLKEAANPADEILRIIRYDTGDSVALEQHYDSLYKKKQPEFGDSLFLDPESAIILATGDEDIPESETFKIEKLVETINLAVFAYNIYMGTEMETCTNSFFRSVACFSKLFTKIELEMHFLLRFAILRQKLDNSPNPESQLHSFLDELFPPDLSKFYVIPNKEGNEQIEYALRLVYERLSLKSDAELIEEEFGSIVEVHSKLQGYIMFRYARLEYERVHLQRQEIEEDITPATENIDQDEEYQLDDDSEEDDSVNNNIEEIVFKINIEDDSNEESKEENEDEIVHDSEVVRTQNSENQAVVRSFMEPDPNGRPLTAEEAGFKEDNLSVCREEPETIEISSDDADEYIDARDSFENSITTRAAFEPVPSTRKSPIISNYTLSVKLERDHELEPSEIHGSPSGSEYRRASKRPRIESDNSESNNSNDGNNQITLVTLPNASISNRENTRRILPTSSSTTNSSNNEQRRKQYINTQGRQVPLAKTRKSKSPWTDEEVKALELGMERFGTRWADIKEAYTILRSRTGVQLKDKAVNECIRRHKHGERIGVFELTNWKLKQLE
ncbi:MAG: hypothetical protein EXX96DRAFT_566733 [Benjaminiella poitrasii]|nr:MAG: hypothetical protein EXX96DRAFT_566733 [Benjaminiella poitrasii]